MLRKEVVAATALLMALVLASSLHGLAASGHFPRRHRAPDALGPIILFGSIAVVAACLAAGVVAALRVIPWYAAIIGGGLSVLAAPPVLQGLPDRFVDGRGALVVFAAACAVLAMVLVRAAGVT